MKIITPLLRLSLTFFLVSPFVFSQSQSQSPSTALEDDLQRVVNDYYKTYNEKEKFTAIAASVLIPSDKPINSNIKTVVAGTIGYAPFDQLITPSNLFDIGSITKSFTAVILLQLQTEGKLSLEDPLGKWLPQYKQWQKVTLKQLLNMTSSIPNYSDDAEFVKKILANLNHVWTKDELLSYANPDKPLKINKSNLYEYCNSNYILAALVIEKVTKDSYENQLKQRILSQKDYFNRTFYPVGPEGETVKKAILEQRVHGYFYDANAKKSIDTIDNDLSWGGAAGALVANTENVAQWVQLLYHGTLINPAYRERILAELESLVSLKTGQPIVAVSPEDPFGFGLGVMSLYDNESKQRFWVYKGSTLGFRVMYYWNPCNNVTTVVALNSIARGKDHIEEANLNLYKAIIKQNPKLKCAV